MVAWADDSRFSRRRVADANERRNREGRRRSPSVEQGALGALGSERDEGHVVEPLKWNGDNVEPTCLGKAEDVAEFGYFQRGGLREMLTFISRTIVKRSGQRQSVEQDQYLVHVSNRNGLVAIAVMDKEYPSRSAFCVLGKMCDDYVEKVVGEAWRTVTEDDARGDALLADAIVRYQDPMEADKILKIQRELDDQGGAAQDHRLRARARREAGQPGGQVHTSRWRRRCSTSRLRSRTSAAR